jgi:uncharacterized ParB-like nuclease family protein
MLATELIEHHPASLPRDPHKVAFFADLLKNGHVFEPVEVLPASFSGGRYILFAGRHTFEAHRLLGLEFIKARLHKHAIPIAPAR